MDMNSVNIEEIVKQVLQGMTGQAVQGSATAAPVSAPAAPSGAIPKTARVAMLTGIEEIKLQEYPIPELGDGDILVKVEGCGICGTDAHEYKRDP
ncbi:MAG: alcohol dehydrogenase catalytic domain-containing protein, partial [Lachnospiraceae bacterium]|nr:alcohol dehydrogenase catalytic domain-containing protein [Lachnospiraceae bacterium]